MLEDFDKNVSILMESFARTLGRRKMVGTTVKGVFATVAAATLGQFTGLGQALASCTCTCDDCWTNGVPCNNIGYNCPTDLSAHQTARSAAATIAVDGVTILVVRGSRVTI